MKKLISLILISVIIMAISINVFATDSVLGDVGDNTTTITGNEYENAQQDTENNDTTLPQTGIESYNIGILLVISIASVIFAYKKISDYRDI